MNFKMIINFLLILSIVGTMVFFYMKDIRVIERNWYVDFSQRLVWNHEIKNIEAYINKNNITYIKVNAKNLDLNRISQLQLNHPENITFQVIDSQDNINAATLTQLVNKYKQIILWETIKDYTQILKQNWNNYEIHLWETSNDLDLFQILFLLKNKNIDKLEITGFNTLRYYQVFFRYFMNTDNIKELSLFDTFEFEQYMFFHEYASNLNKKLFFSPKKEILSLRNMKTPPKDLLLDYITGGLEVKDILDIHTIFWDYEFNLLSIRQNKTQPSPQWNFFDEYKYSLNFELLNTYIRYKKANLVWYNIKINKWFDICKQQKILYISYIQGFANCWEVDLQKDPRLNNTWTNSTIVSFIKSILNFWIEKDISETTEITDLFEEFWFTFNTKDNSTLNLKEINIFQWGPLEFQINDAWNKKQLTEKHYYPYLSFLYQFYFKYSKYHYYENILIKNFSVKSDLENAYLNYILWKTEYDNINFYKVIDNTKNNWILIFYTKKDE